MNLVDRLVEEFERRRRLALLGVGNILKGDDALGSLLIRRVRKFSPRWVLALDCGQTPEGFTDVVKKFMPDLVLVVDAVDAGKPYGNIDFYSVEDLCSLTLNTHKPSLKLLASYLEREVGASFLLIGVQPKDLNYTLKPTLSKPVRNALEVLEEAFREAFSRL